MVLGLFLLLLQPPKAPLIRGRVTALDGFTPVRHAIVKVHGGGALNPYSAATDANGAFEFSRLEPGRYSAFAGKPGYVTTNYRDASESNYFDVVEGKSLEIGFRLPRTVVIVGTVIDAEGDPVVDATVRAIEKAYVAGRVEWRSRTSVLTDDLGNYRLHELPAGRYYIQAFKRILAANGQPTLARAAFPGVARIEEAQALRLSGGEVQKGIDFSLIDAGAYRVSGKVTGPAGTSLANVPLSLVPEESSGEPPASGTIAADGTFRVSGLASGRYTIRGGGGSTNGVAIPRVFRPIEIAGADVNNLSIVATLGVTIKGRIKVIGGEPSIPFTAGGLVERNPFTGGPGRNGRFSIASDGTFQVPDADPATYDFYLDAPPARTEPAEFFLKDASVIVPETASSVEMTLTVDLRAGRISGRTPDASGQPLPRAPVAIFNRASPRFWQTLQSGSGGSFSIRNLAPGDYCLVVWPSKEVDIVLDPELLAALEKHLVRVKLDSSGRITQDLVLTRELRAVAEAFAQ